MNKPQYKVTFKLFEAKKSQTAFIAADNEEAAIRHIRNLFCVIEWIKIAGATEKQMKDYAGTSKK